MKQKQSKGSYHHPQQQLAGINQDNQFMQVKTLDLIQPQQHPTFNVIYQKKAAPSHHTLNSMRKVLNQLSTQQQAQIRLSQEQHLEYQAYQHSRPSQLSLNQGALMISPQKEQKFLKDPRGSTQVRSSTKQSEVKIIKPSSSHQRKYPSQPLSQQIQPSYFNKDQPNILHSFTSFRQQNSRSIAQLKNHVKLNDTQKFKNNEALNKQQKSNPPPTKQNLKSKQQKLVGKMITEPYMLITSEFGTPIFEHENQIFTDITQLSPRTTYVTTKPVALYNFVNTQGQIVTQDYMQVIRQRCENRGIVNPQQTGGVQLPQNDLTPTPRRNISITPFSVNQTITETSTYAQSVHSHKNEVNSYQAAEESSLIAREASTGLVQEQRRCSFKVETNVPPTTNAPKEVQNPSSNTLTRAGSKVQQKTQKQQTIKNKPEPGTTLVEKIFQQMKNLKDQVPMPQVTADAWCVFDTDTEKVLHGKLVNHKRECASLTKMMTFLVSWQLFQRFFPEHTTIDIKIPKYCTQVTGTSAFLRKRDTLKLHQLFYAMLLPSGNDAALVLADYFGGVIMKNSDSQSPPKSFYFPDNIHVRFFLKEMNIVGAKIGMANTIFDSPHGLANNFNISTACEMAILSHHCMQIDVFSEVVRTPFYEVETETAQYEWQNTNRLLGFDFDSEDTVPNFMGTLGCKTGVTPSAGPCFAGCFSRYDNDQVEPDNCIVIVLGSKSMEARWVEVPALVKWYQKVKSMAVKNLGL